MAWTFEKMYVVCLEDLCSLYLKAQQAWLAQRVSEVQLVALLALQMLGYAGPLG